MHPLCEHLPSYSEHLAMPSEALQELAGFLEQLLRQVVDPSPPGKDVVVEDHHLVELRQEVVQE